MVNVIEHRHIQITSYAEGTEIFYEQPFSIFMSKGRNKILYFVTTSYQTIRRFIHSSHELDTSISYVGYGGCFVLCNGYTDFKKLGCRFYPPSRIFD